MGQLNAPQAVIPEADLLRLILNQGNVIGEDDEGCIVLAFRVLPWMFDVICQTDAATEDFEDSDPAEDGDVSEDDDPGEDNNDAERPEYIPDWLAQ